MRNILIGVCFLFFALPALSFASTGGSSTGSTTTGVVTMSSTPSSSYTSPAALRAYLDVQKNNVEKLLLTEHQRLLDAQQQATKIGGVDALDVLLCMKEKGISDLDWSLPTENIESALTDDYIMLRAKIHELEVQEELESDIDMDAAIENLYFRISNYGADYQKLIVQTVQQAQDRYTANTASIIAFGETNSALIHSVIERKALIDNILASYEKLETAIRTSRLLYGMTLQEIAETKHLLKERYAKLMGDFLDKSFNSYGKSYTSFSLFSEMVKEKKTAMLTQFSIDYDIKYNELIGKLVDDSSLGFLVSSINSIKQQYFREDDTLACDILADIGDDEISLLESLQEQIKDFSANVIAADGDLETDKTTTMRKQEYADALQEFYTDTATENEALVRSYVSRQGKMLFALHTQEQPFLDEINQLNQQYWTIEDVQEKEKLREQIILKAMNLVNATVNKITKERCIVVLGAMGVSYRDPEEETIEQKVSPKTSGILGVYMNKITQKYPDEVKRKKVLQIVVSFLKKKLDSGELSTSKKNLYTVLYEGMKKELQRM